jgi:hypothetical protein
MDPDLGGPKHMDPMDSEHRLEVHNKSNENHFNYLLFQKLGITVHIVTYI